MLHESAKTHAILDEERVVAYGGLGPMMRLAERCGLEEPAAEHVAPAHQDRRQEHAGRGLNVPTSTLSTPLAVLVVTGTGCAAGV
ncbi:hypothetical protein ACFQVD_11305 [Streptosporangium amethystogenes subsp. fukuiense]|uniref:Uncharacterized protein n=1 Tax=Streptosporangium amethystogenes subsp. fukuiense TaxID=698418 RepID=A0ABW2SWL3_9ACTN